MWAAWSYRVSSRSGAYVISSFIWKSSRWVRLALVGANVLDCVHLNIVPLWMKLDSLKRKKRVSNANESLGPRRNVLVQTDQAINTHNSRARTYRVIEHIDGAHVLRIRIRVLEPYGLRYLRKWIRKECACRKRTRHSLHPRHMPRLQRRRDATRPLPAAHMESGLGHLHMFPFLWTALRDGLSGVG